MERSQELPETKHALRDEQGRIVLVEPIRKEEAPPEVRSILDDIQDTMGIPWSPANWRSYARYPRVLQLFWERLKPAVATAGFLQEAIAVAELAYRDVSGWYLPSSRIDLADQDRQAVQWELDALEFGNPQLLIQQAALTRVIRGLYAGREGPSRGRSRPSPYRNPEIRMIPEEAAPEPIRQLYQDIKQTLGIPLVNSDYQALAKWPAFLVPAWDDLKRWRPRGEYRRLEHRLAEKAEMAAGRLTPPVGVDPAELQAAFDSQEERESVQELVQMFTHLLPGLIVNDALFRIAATAGQPLPPPTPGA
ncbi:MAG: halocarboxylic acid dehydrogenase DehI family protein [Chloroflexota bacterium]